MTQVAGQVTCDKVQWAFAGQFCLYQALWCKSMYETEKLCTARLCEDQLDTCEIEKGEFCAECVPVSDEGKE